MMVELISDEASVWARAEGMNSEMKDRNGPSDVELPVVSASVDVDTGVGVGGGFDGGVLVSVVLAESSGEEDGVVTSGVEICSVGTVEVVVEGVVVVNVGAGGGTVTEVDAAVSSDVVGAASSGADVDASSVDDGVNDVSGSGSACQTRFKLTLVRIPDVEMLAGTNPPQ